MMMYVKMTQGKGMPGCFAISEALRDFLCRNEQTAGGRFKAADSGRRKYEEIKIFRVQRMRLHYNQYRQRGDALLWQKTRATQSKERG